MGTKLAPTSFTGINMPYETTVYYCKRVTRHEQKANLSHIYLFPFCLFVQTMEDFFGKTDVLFLSHLRIIWRTLLEEGRGMVSWWMRRTVQPSHAWAGNEKQVHRWKKRIYRGPPKKEEASTLLRLHPFFPHKHTRLSERRLCEITCHTHYVSLAEPTCNLRILNVAPYSILFFLMEFLPRENLSVSCCYLLYLRWPYYMFNSSHMCYDFDCSRQIRTLSLNDSS